jgi:hypothetical protein
VPICAIVKINVRAQLGAAFAVPIVTIAVIAATLLYQLGRLEQAQSRTVTLTALSATAQDILLQMSLRRYATRGAVLGTSLSNIATMAKTGNVMEDDFGLLRGSRGFPRDGRFMQTDRGR